MQGRVCPLTAYQVWLRGLKLGRRYHLPKMDWGSPSQPLWLWSAKEGCMGLVSHGNGPRSSRMLGVYVGQVPLKGSGHCEREEALAWVLRVTHMQGIEETPHYCCGGWRPSPLGLPFKSQVQYCAPSLYNELHAKCQRQHHVARG